MHAVEQCRRNCRALSTFGLGQPQAHPVLALRKCAEYERPFLHAFSRWGLRRWREWRAHPVTILASIASSTACARVMVRGDRPF
jgi:hypothetical protein